MRKQVVASAEQRAVELRRSRAAQKAVTHPALVIHSCCVHGCEPCSDEWSDLRRGGSSSGGGGPSGLAQRSPVTAHTTACDW